MIIDAEWLRQRLAGLAGDEAVSRWLVLFSGGLDSTVLLHLLSTGARDAAAGILAVYVDHGLQASSADWAGHCRQVATGFGASFECLPVKVDTSAGSGLEAAARTARYAALRPLTEAGDGVLSAHHQDDQAETLLLNLLRGSGPAGLAGIGSVQPFGAGRLMRPLLDVSREDLVHYAERHELDWIEDPSNADDRFDRNFLRLEVMPLLETRWPAVTRRLGHSAILAGEARELLEALGEQDVDAAGGPRRLDLDVFGRLDETRQRNALRRAIALQGLPAAPASRLRQAVQELPSAREDKAPLVAWPGGELRRYRGHIYVQAPLPPANPAHCVRLGERLEADVGDGLGRLSLEPGVAGGVDPAIVADGLQVRFRQGGETCRPAGRGVSRKLKKLLQESAVVPWMRNRLPLVYSGERLVAIADLWVEEGCTHERGYGIHWSGRPALF